MIKYFFFMPLLISSSGFAISKCLNEVKLVCPKHAGQTTCLKQNMARFSPECTETAKALIGTEETVAAPLVKATPPAVAPTTTTTIVPKVTAAPVAPAPPAPPAPPPAAPQAPAMAPDPRAPKNPSRENVCKKDEVAFCENATAATMNECLIAHMEQLSAGCRGTLSNSKPAKAGAEGVKTACAIELRRICPDAGGDRQKKMDCLTAHQAELPPDCKAFGDPTE